MSRAPSVDPQNAVGGERIVKIHWPAEPGRPAVNCRVKFSRRDGVPSVEVCSVDDEVKVEVLTVSRPPAEACRRYQRMGCDEDEDGQSVDPESCYVCRMSESDHAGPELSVRCPMCGSVEGQPCKRPTRIGAHEGAESPPHRARFDVAGVPFPEKTS
jgi:hypothetical protein